MLYAAYRDVGIFTKRFSKPKTAEIAIRIFYTLATNI